MLFQSGSSGQNAKKTHGRETKGISLEDHPDITYQEQCVVGYAHYLFHIVDLCGFESIIREPQKTTGTSVRTQSLLQTQGLLTFLPSTWPSSTAHSSMALACLSTKAPYLTQMCCFSPATSVNPASLQSTSTLIVQLLHHFQFSNKATISVLYLYSETCTDPWSSALIYKRYLHTHNFPLQIIYIKLAFQSW